MRTAASVDAAHVPGRDRLLLSVLLVLGTVGLAMALRATPGSVTFLLASSALAALWAVGGLFLASPRLGAPSWPVFALVRAGLAAGALLVVVFVLGALVVRWIPALAEPVAGLLRHAAADAFWPVLMITLVNAAAEELFFRGAVYALLPAPIALWGTVGIYTLVTAASGVWLLVLAGFCLGLVTTLQRRATGGVLAPALTHVVWSMSMLIILPSVVSP